MRTRKKIFVRLLAMLGVSLLWSHVAFAQQSTAFGPLTVVYKDSDQLLRFGELIQPSALGMSLGSIFGGGSGGAGSEQEVGRYLNNLLGRVQQVLDMPVPRIKLTIKVFSSQSGLSQEATQVTGRPLREPGFYWHATKTIHVHLDELNIGILAHEMGHAIIDHYLAVKPPPKIAEMLCQYVDKEITAGRY